MDSPPPAVEKRPGKVKTAPRVNVQTVKENPKTKQPERQQSTSRSLQTVPKNSKNEQTELHQSTSSSVDEADQPQNLHCFKCNFPLSLREEIVPHRSGCAVSGAFPETSFIYTRTGTDSHVECLFCHAVADKAHWGEFSQHMYQHSEN